MTSTTFDTQTDIAQLTHKVSQEHRKVKRILKEQINDLNKLIYHANKWKNFNHQSIIKLHEIFIDETYIFLVTESSKNEGILQNITQRETISEINVKKFFNEILSLIYFLKENDFPLDFISPKQFCIQEGTLKIDNLLRMSGY